MNVKSGARRKLEAINQFKTALFLLVGLSVMYVVTFFLDLLSGLLLVLFWIAFALDFIVLLSAYHELKKDVFE